MYTYIVINIMYLLFTLSTGTGRWLTTPRIGLTDVCGGTDSLTGMTLAGLRTSWSKTSTLKQMTAPSQTPSLGGKYYTWGIETCPWKFTLCIWPCIVLGIWPVISCCIYPVNCRFDLLWLTLLFDLAITDKLCLHYTQIQTDRVLLNVHPEEHPVLNCAF